MIESEVKKALRDLVVDLVNGRYDLLTESNRIGRLTEEEIREGIQEYGGTLTIPPEEAYNTCRMLRLDRGSEFAIAFDMWIDNHRSVLTLTCDVTVDDQEQKVVEIKIDLHVL
ncbi:hypothetical protein CBW65_19930 [Tumebacillus avium]|uniref:DUF7668 domain-containing protein n=1 Tax=Tumebacillus avium TaxID=1903704 RepID=A0A1Y0IQY1_9BACL|nr:hypothetical protein [Tumebacillus avium]ARU62998.1 hypothetical protein CBW65_19930 [Tumebacillus avium]